MQKMRELSSKVGYEILHVSNDEITPVSEMDYEDNQKLVIFDDYVCDKNQRQLIDYFIQGRHKNCSVVYLSHPVTSVFLQNSKRYSFELFSLLSI